MPNSRESSYCFTGCTKQKNTSFTTATEKDPHPDYSWNALDFPTDLLEQTKKPLSSFFNNYLTILFLVAETSFHRLLCKNINKPYVF